ncbi:MAG: response regulator [Anaerolineae bacterium]|nr:response regulator [Anaerolineae bacterium]
MRILIADDEAIIRLGLKATLEAMGHQVVGVAADGASAIELARTALPDLVILDIKMPGIDGLDAAEAISRERPVPIVILTAYSSPDLVGRAASLAIHGYLVKPIRPVELGPALEIAVSRFEQARALRQQAADLQEALRSRQVIERAKLRLMESRGLSEGEALRWLRARARRQRRSMREVSDEVLRGEQPFDSAPGP